HRSPPRSRQAGSQNAKTAAVGHSADRSRGGAGHSGTGHPSELGAATAGPPRPSGRLRRPALAASTAGVATTPESQSIGITYPSFGIRAVAARCPAVTMHSGRSSFRSHRSQNEVEIGAGLVNPPGGLAFRPG